MVFSKKSYSKKVWLILITVVLIAGVGFTVYSLINNQQKAVSTTDKKVSKDAERYERLLGDIKKVDTQKVSTEQMVEDFGPQYDTALEEVLKSDVRKWDQVMIDKAHFCLLYADKIGASSQVESLYYLIFGARGSGIDVDTNAAGMMEGDRDEILKKYTTVSYVQSGQIQGGGDA